VCATLELSVSDQRKGCEVSDATDPEGPKEVSANAPGSTRWSRRLMIPEPLQDGSRRLTSSKENETQPPHKSRTNIHVRNVGILLVIKICGEEVYVERLDVAAPRSGQHCLESAIAPAVAFKRKDLLSLGRKRTNKRLINKKMLSRKKRGALYLALILHECAQVRGFVPRGCCGVNDNAPRV
jgi:hypothetical protein